MRNIRGWGVMRAGERFIGGKGRKQAKGQGLSGFTDTMNYLTCSTLLNSLQL